MKKPLLYLKHTPYPNTYFVFGNVSYSIVWDFKGVGILDSLSRGFEWKSNMDDMDIDINDNYLTTTAHFSDNSYSNEYGIIKSYNVKEFYEEIAKLPILLELEK